MISYELAKQLKDVGFPQNTEGDGHMSCGCDDIQDQDELRKVVLNCERERFYKPTLSELIAACGRDYRYLYRSDNGKWWVARNDPGISLPGEGSSPEEAVANLWLEVNKTPEEAHRSIVERFCK